MTADDVRAYLKRECEKAGGQAAWCREHDIAPGYAADVLSGRQEPGEAILKALGIERVVTYRRTRK